jgi:hypothetical protein
MSEKTNMDMSEMPISDNAEGICGERWSGPANRSESDICGGKGSESEQIGRRRSESGLIRANQSESAVSRGNQSQSEVSRANRR